MEGCLRFVFEVLVPLTSGQSPAHCHFSTLYKGRAVRGSGRATIDDNLVTPVICEASSDPKEQHSLRYLVSFAKATDDPHRRATGTNVGKQQILLSQAWALNIQRE